jgi:hypothetical protein
VGLARSNDQGQKEQLNHHYCSKVKADCALFVTFTASNYLRMKNYILLVALIGLHLTAVAQEKAKIKGSKIVTITQKEVGEFQSIEVGENLEVYLIKGDKNGVEIEADDNLHDAIDLKVTGTNLTIGTNKTITGAKKLSIRISYTPKFNTVISKGESSIMALAPVQLDSIVFKSFDNSKVFAYLNSKNVTVMANDKSKGEWNIKAEKTKIELSKNSKMKALIASLSLNCDLYQRAIADIEGDINDMKLRLDNNSTYNGKNCAVKNAELTMEAYTNSNINVTSTLSIDASGKAEIQLYGDQKIDMKRFVDNAILYKKPTK